jgi:DNA-binding response OmpR family regulator
VVEDFEPTARAIATGLRREGMAVDVACDGDEALGHLALTCYDVIVLDRDLPGVHGDEICRRLAAGRSPSRILMLTAAGSLTDRVDGLGVGADDYLAKPFDFPELTARSAPWAAARPCHTPGTHPWRHQARPRQPRRVPCRATAGAQRQGVRRA